MNTDHILTAWRGHEQFVWWLCKVKKPLITVDLGVDEGFSLVELARYNPGVVFGIDHFRGDDFTGAKNVEEIARENARCSGCNIQILNMTFEAAAEVVAAESVDILHIDGSHRYEDVKRDFETWLPKMRPGGVVLLHDTESFPNDVGRFYHELPYQKFKFTHSSGLGVVAV